MTVPDLSRDLDSLPDGDVKALLYALIRSIHGLEADRARLDWVLENVTTLREIDSERFAIWTVDGAMIVTPSFRESIDRTMHAEKGS